MKLNNVDHALTPAPDADLWAEQTEPTEETQPSKLIMGAKPDALFADAHAAGEALREARRAQQGQLSNALDTSAVDPKTVPRVGRCPQCRHHVVIGGWHRPCGCVDAQIVETSYTYYDRLTEAINSLPRVRKRREDITSEWRELPSYPGYLMNSVTRDVWRAAREITLPSGVVRRYPAKEIKPTNGAYSLSVDGVKSSRGIQALWEETFPEYAGKKSRDIAHRDELDHYHGLREWLAEGGASIVTRPH